MNSLLATPELDRARLHTRNALGNSERTLPLHSRRQYSSSAKRRIALHVVLESNPKHERTYLAMTMRIRL